MQAIETDILSAATPECADKITRPDCGQSMPTLMPQAVNARPNAEAKLSGLTEYHFGNLPIVFGRGVATVAQLQNIKGWPHFRLKESEEQRPHCGRDSSIKSANL